MQRWIIKNYFLLGRGGSAGAKFRIALGLPVGAVINCADNTGKKQIFSVHFLLPPIFPISSAFYVYFFQIFKLLRLRWRNFPTFARERCLHSFLFEVHSSTSPALIFLCLRCHFNCVFSWCNKTRWFYYICYLLKRSSPAVLRLPNNLFTSKMRSLYRSWNFDRINVSVKMKARSMQNQRSQAR